MGSPIDARITGMEHKVSDIKDMIETISNRRDGNQGVANVAINAGGVGVWLATTACLIMLGAMLIGAFWISREFDRIDTHFSDAKNTNDIQDAYIAKLRAQQQEKK